MKVIFLDIDGVLNNYEWLHTMHDAGVDPMLIRRELLDRRSVAVLNKIIAQTGALVVISSSWRWGRTIEDLEAILTDNGFDDEVYGATPVNSDLIAKALGRFGERQQRGHEIQAWLKISKLNPEAYVVIDDSGDMAGVEDHLVLIDPNVGLREEDIPAILEKLNESQNR